MKLRILEFHISNSTFQVISYKESLVSISWDYVVITKSIVVIQK